MVEDKADFLNTENISKDSKQFSRTVIKTIHVNDSISMKRELK